MPRKSKELRLKQSMDLLDSYESQNLTSDYRYRFINDMVTRIKASRGLSKKQRDWLDSLIDQGAPEPNPNADEKLINTINDAISLDGMQHRVSVLKDFLSRIASGRRMSEKQQNFLNIMLREADKIKVEGKFVPQDLPRLRNAIQLLDGKNSWYWAHRTGTYTSFNKLKNWLSYQDKKQSLSGLSGSDSIDIKQCLGDEPHIDEWVCNKVLNAAKKGLSSLEDPSHEVGALRYLRLAGKSVSVIITSEPRISSGVVVVDTLADGEVKTVPISDIRKRR